MDTLVPTKNKMVAAIHIFLPQNILKYFCGRSSVQRPLGKLTAFLDLLAGHGVSSWQRGERKDKQRKGGMKRGTAEEEKREIGPKQVWLG